MSEDIREEIATALRKRAEWPSMHWPSLDALQHADVTRALADALMPLVARIQAEAWDAGHKTRWRRGPDDCLCGAWSSNECACGLYGTGELVSLKLNPYRADRLEQGDPS